MSKSEGYLTTHVLDTAKGCPAAGIAISVYKVEATKKRLLSTTITNSDGRCDSPILIGNAFEIGVYELVFKAAEYFSTEGGDSVPFLDEITLRFGVSDCETHYHIPLLVSPYSYSTYRGS
jgi:5-hydroxyisourate hydrolase